MMTTPLAVTRIEDVPGDRPLFIYGGGSAGMALYGLLAASGREVVSFISSEASVVGLSMPCITVRDYVAHRRSGDLVLVASMYFHEMCATLDALGVDGYRIAWPLIHGLLCGQNATMNAYVARFFPDGGDYLDVGANIGVTATLMSRKAGRLFAFEPNPSVFKRLELMTRGMNNVHLVDQAVHDACGTATLHVPRLHEGVDPWAYLQVLASLGPPPADSEPITVTKTTLDVWCRENAVRPVAIKVDVEFEDFKVLAGAWELITSLRPHLIFEMYQFNAEWIARLGELYTLIAIPEGIQSEAWRLPKFLELDEYMARTGGQHPLNVGAVPRRRNRPI